MATQFAVLHFQPITNRWHIEDDGNGGVEGFDLMTALALANGYNVAGYMTRTVPINEMPPNQALNQFNSNLVLTDGEGVSQA